ncbi:MAG: hypothetical protein ACRD5H_09700, partial [Nitrososphaerales archaeon]
MTEAGSVILKASSFEIEPGKSSTESVQQVSGHLGIEDDNDNAFEALKNLCSKENVDKVVIVYRDYQFSLVGVSFSSDNKNPPSIRLGKNSYRFEAKDVHLDALSRS